MMDNIIAVLPRDTRGKEAFTRCCIPGGGSPGSTREVL